MTDTASKIVLSAVLGFLLAAAGAVFIVNNEEATIAAEKAAHAKAEAIIQRKNDDIAKAIKALQEAAK
jgi:ascorbate-specific PTS system EIIC-type component UlaA